MGRGFKRSPGTGAAAAKAHAGGCSAGCWVRPEEDDQIGFECLGSVSFPAWARRARPPRTRAPARPARHTHRPQRPPRGQRQGPPYQAEEDRRMAHPGLPEKARAQGVPVPGVDPQPARRADGAVNRALLQELMRRSMAGENQGRTREKEPAGAIHPPLWVDCPPGIPGSVSVGGRRFAPGVLVQSGSSGFDSPHRPLWTRTIRSQAVVNSERRAPFASEGTSPPEENRSPRAKPETRRPVQPSGFFFRFVAQTSPPW